MLKHLGLLAMLFVCPLSANADSVQPYEEYAQHLRAAQEVAPLTSSEFGDQISLYNAATEFDMVDIDVPGNNALPVQLRRRFEISDWRAAPGHIGGFGEWDVDVPYLEGVFTQQLGWKVPTGYDRCSTPSVPDTNVDTITTQSWVNRIWDGYQMHVPGAGSQDLLVNSQPQYSDGAYPWITKNYTRLTCLPTTRNGYPGEGFLAVSPDGVKTWFDWALVRSARDVYLYDTYAPKDFGGKPIHHSAFRSKVYLLATRIEDRFGNWVTYAYGTDASGNSVLTGINSNDGRWITPTYTNGVITKATSNVGNWTYNYITDPNSIYVNQLSLNSVVRPDNSRWSYNATGSLKSIKVPPDDYVPPPTHCQLDPIDVASGAFTYTVGAPFGAVATYQFSNDRHYRSYVPWGCADNNPDHGYATDVYDFVDNYSIHSKQVNGPGLVPQTWNYAEASSGGYYDASGPYWTQTGSQTFVPPANCPLCALSKLVTVTSPTEITKYTFGEQYARNDGRLLGTEVDGLDGTPLRTTTNTYVADSEVAGLPFPSWVGNNLASNYKNPMAAWIRPQRQSTITQQGVTFTSLTNSWDAFARPVSATRSSSLGYSKTEATAYADNTTNWVIGQVASVTDVGSGQLMAENAYDPTTAMLASSKSFGVLQKSYTYNIDDGTLTTVADGLGHTTTLSNWFRGVPKTVQNADLTIEKAVVNDAGWITGYYDENNYRTGYVYDAMGRVNEIDYPTADSVAWTPTLISFAPVTNAEFGLTAGHWKHIVSTGNAIKTVYYDALLRPVLQREEDAGSAATIRYTEQGFDAANRTVFASYPSASASAYNDLTLGTHAAFDGLGRPTSSVQDSELGALPTTMQYLQGFRTQATNPRGFATTTRYQVFDSPDSDHPTLIQSPEGATTSIVRDVFGKPLSIKRSGLLADGSSVHATRSYVYDANQRLCKRIEPETGATLMDYDGVGNIAWTVAGSALTSTVCDRASVAPADQTLRSYDLRNRPQTVDVAHSTDDLAYTYYNDGALKTLSNGATKWTYAYNKRRLPTTETLTLDGRSKTIAHAYDALGHESSLTYPSGLVVNSAPNALGQPTALTTATPIANLASAIAYFPNGGMRGFRYGNNIVHSLTQNLRELPLRSLDIKAGSAAILDDTYAYDQNANVASITDGTIGNGGNRSMGYDGLDRLTSTSAPNQWWINATTSYDPLDNIRSNQVGNTGSYLNTYSYNPTTWHLDSISGHVNWTLGYDANGNVTSMGVDNYTFDAANRMTAAANKEAYQYDGYGRRVKVTVLVGTNNGKIDYPIYSMTGQLLTDDDQRSGKTTDYVNLNGSLVAKRSATIGTSTWATSYEHTDALHSPVTETNAGSYATAAQHYTPYGEPSSYVQGPGYTGHVTDALTGLTYAQQRYYDPVLGRFLSPDPVQASDTGASFNRYWYANNNPYRFTDADGRQSVGEMIDDNAMQAVSQGSTARAYGWAFAATAWKAFGAESVSQLSDKGLSGSSTGDKVSAGLEIASALPPVKILGEAATLAKDVVGAEKVAAQGTRYAKGELREQVLAKGRQADGSVKCAYCGKPTATTSDHVVPYSKGGPTKIENLDPACVSCNSSKGAKDLHTEWTPPKNRG